MKLVKLVNIGCGAVFHSDWINLDVEPVSSEVRRLDARRPLPFADGSVDAVYHSHVLEHLSAAEAAGFLAECWRVLRPGGAVRVVVPDLEGIAKAYLCALAEGNMILSEWTRLELTDQLARNHSGGEMKLFLAGLDERGLAVVRTRAGGEVDHVLAQMGGKRRIEVWRVWRRLRREALSLMAYVLGGRNWRGAVDEGLFRASGEVHRVMYDRQKLADLLCSCGFERPEVMTAERSRIDGFAGYGFDAVGGVTRKPDSLFMEATKG